MKKTYADKVIAAAKRGSALTLTATEVQTLATEVGQLSRCLLLLQCSELGYELRSDHFLEMATVSLFGPFMPSGLKLSTDGNRWWIQANGHQHVSSADSFAEAYLDALREIGITTPSRIELQLDGGVIYRHLLDAATEVPANS